MHNLNTLMNVFHCFVRVVVVILRSHCSVLLDSSDSAILFCNRFVVSFYWPSRVKFIDIANKSIALNKYKAMSNVTFDYI